MSAALEDTWELSGVSSTRTGLSIRGCSTMTHRHRTVRVTILASDLSDIQNESLFKYLRSKLATKEALIKVTPERAEDSSYPVFELSEMDYESFAIGTSVEISKGMSVAIMTEMGDTATMNAVYKRAKQRGMRVILALPADSDRWCGMVDADPTVVSEERELVLIDDKVRRMIDENRCSVEENAVGWWVKRTIESMFGCQLNPVFRELVHKHGLMKRHWCFSGISTLTDGFLDDCLGVGSRQIWKIGGDHCSEKGMTHAVFTARNELLLAEMRPWQSLSPSVRSRPLFITFHRFALFDLSEHPLSYQVVGKDKVKCRIGERAEFEVFRWNDGMMPVKLENDPLIDTDLMRHAIVDCLKAVKMDHLLECRIQESIFSIFFGFLRKDLIFGSPAKVNETDAWIRFLKSYYVKPMKRDVNILTILLEKAKRQVDWKKGSLHWTHILDNRKLETIPDRPKLFRQCLFAAGIGENKEEYTVLDFAVDKGESKLISAAIAYENSLSSQSTLEDEMAEDHARWAAQSEYFVQEYLLKQDGGEIALDVLGKSLVRFIRDRGDFTAVDLMGIVWHSGEEIRKAVLNRLMLAMQNTLDFETVNEDKTGWMWVKQAVLDHPLWLCDKLNEHKSEDESSSKEERSVILFDLVKDHCESEHSEMYGREIHDEMTKLVKMEPERWKDLTAYKPSIPQSKQLRQDYIEGGRKVEISHGEIKQITLDSDSLEYNAEKIYDSQTYLSGLLLDAHLVQPHFSSLMRAALSDFGAVQIGPVKQASRVLPKSEEYASEGKDHCHWPYSACVIDLVRCSVTVNTLSGLITAMRSFEEFISEHPETLTLVRCKNGFAKFDGKDEVPNRYCDVKMNVACKDDSGKRAVIGEVQFLLDCILKSKKKDHELYEVIRMGTLYKGAARRLAKQWSLKQQLLLTVDNPDRLTRLLTFFPFQLTADNLDFYYLFRSKWTKRHLIDAMAAAIVDRSGQSDVSELSKTMLESIHQMNVHRPLSVGVIELMSSIVGAAGSPSDCTALIHSVFRELAGKRCLIRALVGLDASRKREVHLDERIVEMMHGLRFHDLSADELASVLQGWKPGSSVNIRFTLREIYWSILRSFRIGDATVSSALRTLFELSPIQFCEVTDSYLTGRWNRELPDYMIEWVEQSKDCLPGLEDSFVKNGWITSK